MQETWGRMFWNENDYKSIYFCEYNKYIRVGFSASLWTANLASFDIRVLSEI